MSDEIQDKKAQGSATGHIMIRIAATSFAVLVLLSIVAGVVGLGTSLVEFNVVLGALYYGAVVLLISAGIVYPLASVALRPVDSLNGLYTARGASRKHRCRRLVKSMLASGVLSAEQSEEAQEILATHEDPAGPLAVFFKEHFVPRIHQTIKAHAKSAFFASAIVRSPLVETVTMLSINLNLVRAIVESCGFRPSNVSLFKLYARVMLSALIASGLEEMDLDSMFASLMGGSVASHVTGAVMASATQGMVSAFMVYRVGIMTRDILCSGTPVRSMGALRARSYGEALAIMRESGFVGEVLDVVRARTAQATSVAANKVKNAASHAGKSACDAVTEAVSAVGNAVGSAVENAAKGNGLIRSVARGMGAK